MKSKDFMEFRQDFINRCFALSDAKRIEYTENNQKLDVHTNFRRIGNELSVNPVKVMGVYLLKHVKSLITFFKMGKTFSNETLESRIMDIINYLILLISYLHYEETKVQDSDVPEDRLFLENELQLDQEQKELNHVNL